MDGDLWQSYKIKLEVGKFLVIVNQESELLSCYKFGHSPSGNVRCVLFVTL